MTGKKRIEKIAQSALLVRDVIRLPSIDGVDGKFTEVKPDEMLEICRLAQRSIDPWIPMFKQKPPIGKEFLGYIDGDIDHFKRLNERTLFNMNSNNLPEYDKIMKHITHWMPVPPEPDESEKL